MQGCLKLNIGVKEGRSYLLDMYFTAPFKVMNISPRKAVKLDLMIMSSSPGMLDQDKYDIKISLQSDSYVNLFNQAYQRIYPSAAGTEQEQIIHLHSGSTLVYLATPLVPHQSAHFTSISKIFLEDNATLILGEILTCGRSNQENPFAFKLLKLDVEIYFGEEGLVFKEKQHLDPAVDNLQQMGLYDEFTHQASLYVFNNTWDHTALTAELTELLTMYPKLTAGVTSSWKYGTVVKILGTKAEELVKILDQLKNKITPQI